MQVRAVHQWTLSPTPETARTELECVWMPPASWAQPLTGGVTLGKGGHLAEPHCPG